MITILGATGNIGSKVTDSILAKGEKTRLIARDASKLRAYATRGAEAFAGDARNDELLAKAFKDSNAVLTMVPTDLRAKDLAVYQDAVIESVVDALRKAKITHAVNISSLGAELPSGTGPIAGLHRMENRLNNIKGLNVLHIRSPFYMENLLMQIPLMKSRGIMGGAIKGDIKMPMIATKDIAKAVAERLIKRDFTGSSVRELLGQSDISFNEVAGVIGTAIGMPDLRYVQFSYEEAEKGFVLAGLSADVARRFVEMSRAFNEGKISKGIERKEKNTTPTSLKEFAEVFASFYKKEEAKAA